MILTHTGFYEYRHGKMLMHFKFCFEGIPAEPSPAAMLKHYRKRRGFTIRQLAEQVGIVSATLLKYEGNQFPIPYPTAVAFADILPIDRNLLLDALIERRNNHQCIGKYTGQLYEMIIKLGKTKYTRTRI